MKRMSIEKITSEAHASMNETVLANLDPLEDSYVAIRIDDLLKERGITQKDLALMTGIRLATISDLVNGKGTNVNWVQMLAIMVALRVTDLTDIMDLRVSDSVRDRFDKEAEAMRVW